MLTPCCSSNPQDYTSDDGSPLPRCNQETHFTVQSSARRARCPAEHVVNPNNVFRIVQNVDLRKEIEEIGQSAVQVKPQHVSLKLRISEFTVIHSCLLLASSVRPNLAELKYRVVCLVTGKVWLKFSVMFRD